ncbi:nuclear pore complex component-domain-containing protein [Xylaria bambusicola]|uniref:nuclear pore complex component-domain-containing protein n=1 Tax=Xylaria bambusicola TaxID=326684 RepID=UPI002007B0E7|nr:nuclear pore complex component-domain-containing protein [Xylaria bambusicola]KAI0525411.1 nuclear pore complex component-domain-containing protein [Xylaria bambusicola]
MASTAASVAVSTPTKKTPTRTPTKPSATPVTDSPGTWRHPRIEEITRRQEASAFTEKNVRRILINVSLLIFLFLLLPLLKKALPPRRSVPQAWTWFQYISYILYSVPLVNIVLNLAPLFLTKDDCSDIPLTSGQRRLLGLPPLSAPPTPGSEYSTPPRYTRTPSASGSARSRRSFSGSPKVPRSPSNQGSPTPAGNGSSFASPSYHLLQKAMNGARHSSRGSIGSIGSPSPVGGSISSGVLTFGSGPESPSPSPAGKRSTVGLNSKWRYEKGMHERGKGFRELDA